MITYRLGNEIYDNLQLFYEGSNICSQLNYIFINMIFIAYKNFLEPIYKNLLNGFLHHYYII
jgi:hypothetical protein